MEERKNVCLLKYNKKANGFVVKNVSFENKKYPITDGFNDAKIIGQATNIISKKDGLYADLKYKDKKKVFTEAYPSIRFSFDKADDDIDESELKSIGIGINPHAQRQLRNNLNR